MTKKKKSPFVEDSKFDKNMMSKGKDEGDVKKSKMKKGKKGKC